MKKWRFYEWSVVLFFLILPSVSTVIEVTISHKPLMNIALKWFVFYAIGLRLGTAGIMQITNPHFTAREIFDLHDDKAFVVVRELGCANLCFSIIAVMSLYNPSFRLPAAICGGLFFGFAGITHITKAKDSHREVFAMISDIFAFVMISVLALHG